MSLPDDDFDKVMEYYDADSISEAKQQAKEDMKTTFIEKVEEEVDL